MNCVVVLQNCIDLVEGETGYYSETCVMCAVEGPEEVSIKVEEAIDIKEEVSMKVEEAVDIKVEIPEFVSVPSIKTEHEVRLWCVCLCEVVASHALKLFIAPEKNCEITLTISCIVFNLCAIYLLKFGLQS
jgi:hypothetical protein